MPRAPAFDIWDTPARPPAATAAGPPAPWAPPPGPMRPSRRSPGRPKHVLFAEALGDVPDREARVRRCMAEFEAILVAEARGFGEMPGARWLRRPGAAGGGAAPA